jgi:F0F1-type ATP synthase membrane subunit b/b'
VSPALATFLFEAANFTLLALALGWVLFRPVRRALDAERERHEEKLTKVAEREKAVEAEEGALEAARAGAESDLAKRRDAELAAAKADAERLLQEARDREREMRTRLDDEIAAARRRGVEALTEDVAALAAGTVRRLLEAISGPELELALAREVTEALAALGDDLGPATVESARPLGDEARQVLGEALKAEVRERLVPELGAGIRVSTRAGQVDASALAFARAAQRATVLEAGREAGRSAPPESERAAEGSSDGEATGVV